jgi:SAM-dependent methyltransferase
MKLTAEHLKRISDSVGARTGWDFSRVRSERAPVPWEYLDVVRSYLAPDDVVMDVGTGGGEVFLTLASSFGRGLGVDHSPTMIEQARRNQAFQRVSNASFAVMDGYYLGFSDAAFDMVLNRHCDVAVAETVRVLRAAGHFVTQQVACGNTLNLLQAFGWSPDSFGENWWQSAAELASALEESGCRVLTIKEYDVPYWFRDLESLVYWLKSVPLPEPFDIEKHCEGVNRIVDEYQTLRGIETNEHRELLVVQKTE